MKTIERGIAAPAHHLGSRTDDAGFYRDGDAAGCIVERLRSDLAA